MYSILQHDEDLSIDIKGSHSDLDVQYNFETCHGLLCNAGKCVFSKIIFDM